VKPQVKSEKKDKVKRVDRPGDDKSRAAAMRAVEAALEKKGLEPVLLDVREMASYTDFILIVSARSDRQVQAVSENVADVMKKDGRRTVGTEGIGTGHWSLLDFGDVIVHVFYHPVREYYDLEGLWSDAERVPLEIPPDARIGVEEMYDHR
jgi:ribosome-associated protein